MIQFLICPVCEESLSISSSCSNCAEGHSFSIIDGVIDLMPENTDSNLLMEQHHWNEVSEKGHKLKPDTYFNSRLFQDTRTVLKDFISHQYPRLIEGEVKIGEIGCGGGSAIDYLSPISFTNVVYVGSDITLSRMSKRLTNPFLPNWTVKFVRASASRSIYKSGSLDILFCNAALHHMGDYETILNWISSSLRKGGLFILIEPSNRNPFARVARKFAGDFHTKGEKPLMPSTIKTSAESYQLKLRFELGLHFVSGATSYLVGALNLPKQISIRLFEICRILDAITANPSSNYKFVQIYEKL